MEEIRKLTPNKQHTKYKSLRIHSPRLHKTPVKQNEYFNNQGIHSTNGNFSILPSHMTPPSGLTKFIARNPFEHDLTNRLHMSVISPTVFSKFSSPTQDSPGFTWSVEELALIQPAKIEECPSQQVHFIDPEVEVKAQAAIDKFFDANEIVPSPWEDRKKENKVPLGTCTPTRVLDNSISSKESVRLKKDAWSQTVLTLPPELPLEVEEVLKPYFTFTKEQNTDSDDANSSNNSLRRKLFFNHDECYDHDEEDSSLLSSEKINGSLTSCSPPQSGMFIHGTPVKKCSAKLLEQYHGTPVTNFKNLSPPNMSPIYSSTSEMSCQSIKTRCFAVTRLDFTAEMSIEHSLIENKTSDINDLMDVSGKVTETKSNGDQIQNLNSSVNRHEHNKKNDLTDKQLIPQHLISLKCNEKYENTVSGVSSQDTGYQTCSISNIASITDSCNITPVKDKLPWSNRILTSVEDVSDWKENIKNVFCSTPSRCNRENYN